MEKIFSRLILGAPELECGFWNAMFACLSTI